MTTLKNTGLPFSSVHSAGDAFSSNSTAYTGYTDTITGYIQGVMGNLPVPAYGVEASGKVVVRIKVDQYGKVTDAVPGAQGTTVQDATLWEAAKKAALEARFNISQSAPIIQEGTITYVFTLR